MQKPIISLRNITKSYRLYNKPSDRLKEALLPWRSYHTVFDALHDISFDIYPGEYFGIVGINGAGKSTLLQILTGVLTPTSGTLEVNGKVAALLELGAGFNAELSGRENVEFQMQIAGINASEIPAKILEVQNFAEVGDFFDQPMKLYSSGMFARVAFASSILTEPDILIIDEALAVGDARFQKKCMDHMQRMKENGVTIILVSHDIYGTKAASSRMLLLDKGRMVSEGEPEDVAARYMQILFPTSLDDNGNSNAPCVLDNVATESSAGRVDCEEYFLEVYPEAATNIWGHGGVSISSIRCYGIEPPNIFTTDKEIVFEYDIIFDFPKLYNLALQNNLELKWNAGIRMDTSTGLALSAIPGEVNSGCAFTSDSPARAKVTIKAFFPRLVVGDYFFSPGIILGTWDNYLPLAAYENMLVLRCQHDIRVHGLLGLQGSTKLLFL